MISKKTVLILGAGASCHLDFPLGQALIEDVYRFVYAESVGIRNVSATVLQQGNQPLIDAKFKNAELLERFLDLSGAIKKDGKKYTSKDVEQFAEHLFRSQPSSIDFFLEKNPHYGLLGKICIIFCLSRHENQHSWRHFPSRFPERLQREFPNFGWYQYLWHRMTEGCKTLNDLIKNKITIITFNYDRSLEHYLMEAIKSFFNAEEADAAEVFKAIKIKHVYGKLGKFYWEVNYLEDSSSKGPDEIMMETAVYTPWEINCFFRLMGSVGEYGMARSDFDSGRTALSQSTREALVKKFNRVAQEIRTFYEAINEDRKKEYVADIYEAQKIYFLGFGYHELNMKALGLDTEKPKKDAYIFGTALGKTPIEVNHLKGSISNLMVGPNLVDIRNLWDRSGDPSALLIKNFLREVAPLD